jgi:hypothetical protein
MEEIMIDISKLTCETCGIAFNLEKDGGCITRHMEREQTECRACAVHTRAHDARFQAAQILLKPIDLFVSCNENSSFHNWLPDVEDALPELAPA